METIYTILFTDQGMSVTLFAASSRALLAHKVRDAANELITMLNDGNPEDPPAAPLGPHTDLDTGAKWFEEMYGYEYEVEAHTEDV